MTTKKRLDPREIFERPAVVLSSFRRNHDPERVQETRRVRVYRR